MLNVAALIETRQFYHAFQPLRRLPGHSEFGYEALLRCTSSLDPGRLFQSALEQNQLFSLDTWSIVHALSVFLQSEPAQDETKLLFVNIFPSTLVADGFPAFMDRLRKLYPSRLHRIVFELNETVTEEKIWNAPLFLERIDLIRSSGGQIALDDVGEGTASFRKIVEIAPDFIKIDRFFSNDLAAAVKKQQVVRLFVDFCGETGSTLVLEGIEREEDLALAVRLGVPVGQGYHLGKPAKLPGS
ncbi:EAL domain-containing protein [Cohnella hongkongensis]|uniref:EAL domain-containing protein n=1 Tax=Cohnella hongkongensis TaxID=178337 RepID=A0ABV9FI64_9BACL